jgi:carbon monoxide dehydrogenase subunit G
LIIDQNVTIPAPVERVWNFMMDVPAVSTCVPGVEGIEQVSTDVYKGVIGIKVGPVGLHMKGQVTLVEQNRDEWTARMDVEATDRRIPGNVNAKAWMRLTPRSDGHTDLAIHTDASILGKLGQFGQAVMKKKADQVIGEFARNMSSKLEGMEADDERAAAIIRDQADAAAAEQPAPSALVTDPAAAEGGRVTDGENEQREQIEG